jgi:predicted GNAT family acetyltransferase
MAYILGDISREAVYRASLENHEDSFTCLSVVPEIEVYTGEDMIRIGSPGIPNWLSNSVLRCRLSDNEANKAIDETIRYFRGRGVKPYWRICPGDLPIDLESRLQKKGLIIASDQPAMAVEIDKVNQEIKPAEGFTIERLTGIEELKEKNGWIRSLGEGKTLGTLILKMWSYYGFDPNSSWQHYIGTHSGKPVCWASVFYSAGVAGIYGVGTVAEARRQGYGSAITLRGLLDARQKGYRVGVLQSSPMGYNVYKQMGFETYFHIKTYGS